MTFIAVLACWCLGACLLAPLAGMTIRRSRLEAQRAEGALRNEKIAEVA
jgi:hypothetical protein